MPVYSEELDRFVLDNLKLAKVTRHIATYNGKMYNYIVDSEHIIREIVTCRREKTDGTFTQSDKFFYKSVTEEDLTDIFDVTFLVYYDAGIPDRPDLWEIAKYDNGTIMLRYADGVLPGWDIKEDNVCVKWFRITDFEYVTAFYMFYRMDGKPYKEYRRPNGEAYEDYMSSAVDIPLNSVHRIYEDYRPMNL